MPRASQSNFCGALLLFTRYRKVVKIMSKIKEARIKLGLTQEDIAKVLKVKNNTISNWENGVSKPRGRKAKALAAILELPLEDII